MNSGPSLHFGAAANAPRKALEVNEVSWSRALERGGRTLIDSKGSVWKHGVAGTAEYKNPRYRQA